MTSQPFTNPVVTAHQQYARLSPHRGSASFRLGETVQFGFAELFLPADGQVVVAVRTATDQTSQDLATDLVIEGTGESGPFRIECPQCSTSTVRPRATQGLADGA